MKNTTKTILAMSLVALFAIPFSAEAQKRKGQNSFDNTRVVRNHYNNRQFQKPDYRGDFYRHRNNIHHNRQSFHKKRYRNNGQRYRRPAPRFIGMHPRTMTAVMIQINNTGFDRERLQIAKTAIRYNGASTAQVIRLMERLSFDKNRLDLAIFAFDHVIDYRRFFLAADALTFYSNRNRLLNYIR